MYNTSNGNGMVAEEQEAGRNMSPGMIHHRHLVVLVAVLLTAALLASACAGHGVRAQALK